MPPAKVSEERLADFKEAFSLCVPTSLPCALTSTGPALSKTDYPLQV